MKNCRTLSRLGLLAVAITIAACSYVTRLDLQAVDGPFKFLHDNQTTRQEVLTRLGEAASLYENGRILTYILREYRGQLRVDNYRNLESAGDLRRKTYHLVLVFGSDGVLERHSLVRVL